MTIDEVVGRAVDTGVVPGAVALIAGPDGIRHEAAAGNTGPDTVFRLASLTKAMTSVAALQLVERGELRLDQPVTDVLPQFGELSVLDGFDGDQPRLRPPARPATITHLLTHTSGLGYWWASEDLLRWHQITGAPTLATGQRAAIDTPLLHDPGERWTYGVSTDWLGQVIEAVSGRTLDEQLREHVWQPLGMSDAGFYPSAEQLARTVEVPSRAPDGGLAPSGLVAPEPEFAAGGSGAFASAGDYARFLRTLLRGGELAGERILEPQTVELMFTDHLGGARLPDVMRSAVPELSNDVPGMPFKQGFGLGLHLVLEDMPGMRRAGSGDWAGLFNCYFWIDRESAIAAVVMTQLLPFFDARMVETLLGYEAAVYAQIGAGAAA